MIKKIIFILLNSIFISACSDSVEVDHSYDDVQYYEDNSQTGDLIMWGISPELIIKTYVGAKQNIAENTVLSSPFLGQFPINFEPTTHISNSLDNIENVADFENPMQFNLLLNQAKDIPINNFYDKNHKNQVKVHVQNFSKADPLYFKYKQTPREWINYLISHQYVKYEDSFKKFDLDCYSLNFDSSIAYHCIGRASDQYQTEFLMKITKNIENQQIITTTVETPLYPNVRVECRMTRDSLNDWKVVDRNIWHLLSIWNVSQYRK
ncbi:MAG: hypothetical protein Q4F77_13000 [Acinetobacter sp.]|uniref:hypothetical protein n=1 Tax=Acinetobacter TaxID=469 RepID=UPI0026DF5971|nr:hypothetical protein [Acinetobacter sp.]MDO5544199.1 hypothetical protein [Acinetobacter sp.]